MSLTHAVLSAATASGNGQQMPVTLAIVAIVALALVTALFARRHMLHRK